MNIEWNKPLPYDHKGRWQKNLDSIMDPGQKITWPQFIAECIIYNRTKFWTIYKDVKRGPEWHKTIPKHVRDLVQQAYVLCNYFPFVTDEPLVMVAFKNVFRNFGTTKIGQYRKVRVTKGGKQNITQDEKDVITAVNKELQRLIEQRNSFKDAINTVELTKKENVTHDTSVTKKKDKRMSLSEFLKKQELLNKPS